MAPNKATSNKRPKTKKHKNTIREMAMKTKDNNGKVSPLKYLRIKCPICFENIEYNAISSTKCGHVFCTKCLLRSLKLSATCPTCRTKLRGPNAHHALYLQCADEDCDCKEDTHKGVLINDYKKSLLGDVLEAKATKSIDRQNVI